MKGCFQLVFNLLILVWLSVLTLFVIAGGTDKVFKDLSISPEMLRSVEQAIDSMYEGKAFTPEMKAKIDAIKEKIEDKKTEMKYLLESEEE